MTIDENKILVFDADVLIHLGGTQGCSPSFNSNQFIIKYLKLYFLYKTHVHLSSLLVKKLDILKCEA